MTTTHPFSPRRSRPARRRHALVLALLAAMSLSACGGADDDGEQATGTPDASHSGAVAEPAPPASRTPAPRTARRSGSRFGDTELTARLRRQRHGTRSRRPAAADAHLPRPQQRREDRAASPRAVARRCARRARSRRRRHRLLGARRRLRPLLRRRRRRTSTASCAIGEFDGDMDALERQSDGFSVTIERANDVLGIACSPAFGVRAAAGASPAPN